MPESETCAPSNLNVCGRVLNPLGDYRVAVNDYVANGGSGFTMLQFNTAKVNTASACATRSIDYLQRLDDPQFEGPYTCNGTPSADTCHGAIRCDDPRFAKLDAMGKPMDPYLNPFNAITPDLTFRFCPMKSTVGNCFGHMVCVLPHNQGTDGRIRPRSNETACVGVPRLGLLPWPPATSGPMVDRSGLSSFQVHVVCAGTEFVAVPAGDGRRRCSARQ